MLKFSSHLSGGNENLALNAYINFGTNFKFPTMFQELSSPATIGPYSGGVVPSLEPEKNSSTEIGFELIRELPEGADVDGWKIGMNYFRNSYENKIRTYYLPYVPVAYYDNVQNAEICLNPQVNLAKLLL